MQRAVVILLFAGVVTACRYGVTTEKFTPARHPAGVHAEIATETRQISGELIALRDDGLVILEEKTLRLLPYTTIATSRFDQVRPHVDVGGGRPPTAEARDRLRLLSRFPQGLTPELLAELLRAYGQAALAGIDR